MDILLHLGAHRCASTTFQTHLWNNRVRLAGQGLTCWTPRRTRDGLMRAMMRHPALMSHADEQNAQRSVGRMRVEMARLRNAGQRALLIAEENLIGSMRNNILDTRLYPMLQDRMARFEPLFGQEKLTIALTVRNYEDYWTSALMNLVMRGRRLPSDELLDCLTTQPRRWHTMVRDIAKVFPNADIIIWPFERMAGQPAAQLRAMWPQAAEALDLDVGLWLNRGADLLAMNKHLALCGEPVVQDGLIEAGTRWTPFNEGQSAALREHYRRDLAWLEAGAEGLARYIDGRHAPTPDDGGGLCIAATHHTQTIGSTRSTHAPRPDRAEVTRAASLAAAQLRGQNNGIQERYLKD